jgi:hypothetical protein
MVTDLTKKPVPWRVTNALQRSAPGYLELNNRFEYVLLHPISPTLVSILHPRTTPCSSRTIHRQVFKMSSHDSHRTLLMDSQRQE